MKTTPSLLLFLFGLIWINSCTSEEDQQLNVSYQQLLGDKQYIAHEGRLIFKDENSFKALWDELSGQPEDALDSWEKEIGFNSLRRRYEEAVVAEDTYLNELLTKYDNNTELSREQLGFSKTAKGLLDKGSLYINEDGILDMNVTTPGYARFVNEDGIIQVGEKIIQYKRNSVKTIVDGDHRKIEILKNTNETTNEISVSEVTRNVHKTLSSGRTMSLSSCIDTEDNYRLIVYEEFVSHGDGAAPCPLFLNNYYLTLRSLHKSFGQWWNHKTNYLSATVTYTAIHRNCDGSFNQYIGIWQESDRGPCSLTHTCYIPMITDYDTGPCTNSSSVNCSGQNGFVTFNRRQHTGRGKNGTTCNVGAW